MDGGELSSGGGCIYPPPDCTFIYQERLIRLFTKLFDNLVGHVFRLYERESLLTSCIHMSWESSTLTHLIGNREPPWHLGWTASSDFGRTGDSFSNGVLLYIVLVQLLCVLRTEFLLSLCKGTP